MRRIVILSAFLTPFRSGAEACSEEVPLALETQFDFTIITARLRRNLPKRDQLHGKIPIVRIGLGLPLDKWLFPFLAPFTAKKLKPDIIHAVLESFAGLALVFCWFIVPKAKRILTCQSTNTKVLLGIMHRSVHRITCISSVLLERAKRFRRGDALLIPNGLRLDAIPLKEKVSGRILFVGRLEPMKGVDTLLTAFAKLKIENGKLKMLQLHIVGDGSQRKNLEQLATVLGISSRVTFLGRLPIEQVYQEFAEAEIFCGLSRSEALGNVFLEAQAAGCAVIGTNVGGVPDIVEDKVNGLLVPPNDATAARGAMELLLSDEALRKSLSQAGREHVQKFDWSIIARRYADMYENV